MTPRFQRSDQAPTAPWFDDLSDGDVVPGRGRTVTEADVVSFATLTGDFHPQHVDAAWSAEHQFGERVAHGMLVASYAIGLLDLPFERIVALRRIKDLTFKRPVRLGDTIRVSAQIDGLRELDDAAGMVACRVKIASPEGLLIARMVVEVLWRRDPKIATDAADSAEAVAAASAISPAPTFVAIPF